MKSIASIGWLSLILAILFLLIGALVSPVDAGESLAEKTKRLIEEDHKAKERQQNQATAWIVKVITRKQ